MLFDYIGRVTSVRAFELCCFYVLLIISTHALAAEALIKSSVDSKIAFIDNVLLSDQNSRNEVLLSIAPSFNLTARTPVWNIDVGAGLRDDTYKNNGFDTTQVNFNSIAEYMLERDTYSLNAGYVKKSSLNTDADIFGLSSNVLNKNTLVITPRYSRRLTERLRLAISYSVTDVSYDEQTATFAPFNMNVTSANLSYNYNLITAFNATMRSTKYQSEDGLSDFDLFSVQVGAVSQVHERVSLNVSVGVTQRTTVDEAQDIAFLGVILTLPAEKTRSNTTVLSAGVSAAITSESDLGISLARTNAANLFGGLDQVDRVALNYDSNFAQSWSISVNSGYTVTQSVSSGLVFSDRNILTLNVSLEKWMSKYWRLRGTYLFTEQNYTGTTVRQNSSSERLSFQLSYKFKDLSIF